MSLTSYLMEFNEILELSLEHSNVMSIESNLILGDAVSGKLHFYFYCYFILFLLKSDIDIYILEEKISN